MTLALFRFRQHTSLSYFLLAVLANQPDLSSTRRAAVPPDPNPTGSHRISPPPPPSSPFPFRDTMAVAMGRESHGAGAVRGEQPHPPLPPQSKLCTESYSTEPVPLLSPRHVAFPAWPAVSLRPLHFPLLPTTTRTLSRPLLLTFCSKWARASSVSGDTYNCFLIQTVYSVVSIHSTLPSTCLCLCVMTSHLRGPTRGWPQQHPLASRRLGRQVAEVTSIPTEYRLTRCCSQHPIHSDPALHYSLQVLVHVTGGRAN